MKNKLIESEIRKMMNFIDYKVGMTITEQNDNNYRTSLLNEQNTPPTVSPVELVETYMTNDLNRIISNKQEELAGKYEIAVAGGGSDGVQLRFGEGGAKGLDFKKNEYLRRWRLPIPEWKITLPTDDIDFIAELENSQPYGKNYKAFFAVNDDIVKAVKKQLNNVKVGLKFKKMEQTDDDDGFGGFQFALTNKKPKNAVNFGQSFPITKITPLGNKLGLGTNSMGIKVGDNTYGVVWSSGLETILIKLKLKIPAELLPEEPPIVTTTTTEEDINIPTFSVEGANLPYADNMIMPYFNKYPEAEEHFSKIVNAFVKYINAGGGDKLTNVNIKGSADSAAPNENIPSGYSKLDHPGDKPFGGIPSTDLKGRNQWLADNRAKEYANALIRVIKDMTGFDLKIEVLPGDNYYGQGPSKRGQEYRKITLTPNAPTHKGPAEKK